MRSDRDQRTDNELEIDDFLSQFETPDEELSTDVSSYLSDKAPETNTATRNTFYGKMSGKSISDNSSKYANRKPRQIISSSSNSGYGDYETGDARSTSTVNSPVNSTESKPAPQNSPSLSEYADFLAEPVREPEPAPQPEVKPEVKTEAKSNKKEPKPKKERNKKAKAAAQDAPVSGKKTLKQKLFLKPNPAYDPTKGDVYELNGKKIKNKPMKISIKKIILDCIGFCFICGLCGVIYALSCIITAPSYDFSDIYSEVDTASVIYDQDGNEIDSVFYTQDRKILSYDEMPENLINSFIAIEDKTFWTHHGFNWVRMFGAVLSSITGDGRISGTSTITQQLARNVYLADIKSQRSIKRKIIEMYYAARIESALSKEEIVAAYLNSIYLGFGCYGVDAAAHSYFSCEAKDLTLVQCAALAALPKMPHDYALLKYAEADPIEDPNSITVQTDPDIIATSDNSKDRRDLTLALMLDQNMITQEEYDKNVGTPLNSFINPTITQGNGNNSYFHEYLVDTIISDLMEQYGMDYADAERTVYTRGLQIYSTMDKKAQDVIVKEFKDPDNFPSVSSWRKDGDGNILDNYGNIALYKYNNHFDKKGNFVLKKDDVKINSDGSITIIKGRNLNIYHTEYDGVVDYSLEFKNYYRYIDDLLYSHAGGYINIPADYKSLDSDGNLVISADYFADELYADAMVLNPKKSSGDGDEDEEENDAADGAKVLITKKAYTLSPRSLQPQGAMVITEVGTGEIKAMVGGRAFNGQKLLNRAINLRQPGSSIKPLTVYAAALQKSYELQQEGKKYTYTDYHVDKQGIKGWGSYITVHSSVEDEKMKMNGREWPKNFSRKYSGKNTFKTAIQHSHNTCAVKILLQVGVEFSMNQLKKFGITSAIDDESLEVNDMNNAALALGAMGHGVTPLEMALAYGAFPGEGQVCTAVVYTKVLDRKGDVLLEKKTTKSEALNPGVAWIMCDVLQSVVSYNGYMYFDNFKAGGKTGTTNDTYDIWFDGFTPSYTGSLWIGTDQNIEMGSASALAARLWGRIMKQIPNAQKGQYPDRPSNVVRVGGEYFTDGTQYGLDKYVGEDLKKKIEKAMREKWEAEREAHKIWVVDVPAHYETIHHDATVEERPILDADGNPVLDEDGNPMMEQVVTEAYDEQLWVEEVGHWDYEVGWRDGDFKFEYDDNAD